VNVAETRFNFFQKTWLVAPAVLSNSLYFGHIYSYFLPFHRQLTGLIPGNLIRWQSGRPHVTSYVTFLTWLFLSIPWSNFKSTKPCNPNFGEVLRYLQEGLSNTESKSECAVGSDHNTEYGEAEW